MNPACDSSLTKPLPRGVCDEICLFAFFYGGPDQLMPTANPPLHTLVFFFIFWNKV